MSQNSLKIFEKEGVEWAYKATGGGAAIGNLNEVTMIVRKETNPGAKLVLWRAYAIGPDGNQIRIGTPRPYGDAFSEAVQLAQEGA